MYKPQNFRARRNLSDHRLQSPQFTSDKLRPRDIKGLFPDQVTPNSSFLSQTGFCETCKLHTYASYFFLDLYHSQPFTPSSPRSIFMTSQSFGHPREQSKWWEDTWSCGIIAFLNGNQSANKWRAKIIRPLWDSGLCATCGGRICVLNSLDQVVYEND